jgi:hypothetical protein
MTWHAETVTLDSLDRLLVTIRRTAGTVVKWERVAERVRVTWTTAQ